MRKWNLPLTYGPKIQPVIDGEIRQTIRIGRKFNRGDLIRFYRWTAYPYRSERRTLTEYFTLVNVQNILISPDGFGLEIADAISWSHPLADLVARLDGSIPPTGEALRDILMSKNKIPKKGKEAQIIRW
jgi:hypothetical protein